MKYTIYMSKIMVNKVKLDNDDILEFRNDLSNYRMKKDCYKIIILHTITSNLAMVIEGEDLSGFKGMFSIFINDVLIK